MHIYLILSEGFITDEEQIKDSLISNEMWESISYLYESHREHNDIREFLLNHQINQKRLNKFNSYFKDLDFFSDEIVAFISCGALVDCGVLLTATHLYYNHANNNGRIKLNDIKNLVTINSEHRFAYQPGQGTAVAGSPAVISIVLKSGVNFALEMTTNCSRLLIEVIKVITPDINKSASNDFKFTFDNNS